MEPTPPGPRGAKERNPGKTHRVDPGGTPKGTIQRLPALADDAAISSRTLPVADAGNVLYYGDNLDVLRRHVADESVDLVYLDPPFNSNASYSVLFGHADGSKLAAQIKAFDDTWHWDQAAAAAFKRS